MQPINRSQCKQLGFTLVELIAVIVILAIVAGFSTRFIVSSVEQYNQTQFRAKLVNKSRQALERMTRQLRLALPHSVRFTAGQGCIAFLPVVGGGNYTTRVPDQASGGSSGTIVVGPYRVDLGEALMVSIGAMSSSEVFGVSPDSVAVLNAAIAPNVNFYAAGNLNISGAKQWVRNSPQRRFYLLDNPEAFCVVGGELRYYNEFDTSPPWNTEVDPMNDYQLLSTSVTAGALAFDLLDETESRSAVIIIDISFTEGGETVNYEQQVHLRNVP